MKNTDCKCGSNLAFEECCEPFLKGVKKAPTALALMRSRYSAYTLQKIDYLWNTTHFSEQKWYSKEAILQWSIENDWQKLEILSFSETTVEFKAFYKNKAGNLKIHHEFSRFIFENEQWFYTDGDIFET